MQTTAAQKGATYWRHNCVNSQHSYEGRQHKYAERQRSYMQGRQGSLANRRNSKTGNISVQTSSKVFKTGSTESREAVHKAVNQGTEEDRTVSKIARH